MSSPIQTRHRGPSGRCGRDRPKRPAIRHLPRRAGNLRGGRSPRFSKSSVCRIWWTCPWHPPPCGTANLRGSVLPITSLRVCFRCRTGRTTTRPGVVVVSHGTAFGSWVDRMASVRHCRGRRDRREPKQPRRHIDTDMLSGVIKREGAMIMILDPPA